MMTRLEKVGLLSMLKEHSNAAIESAKKSETLSQDEDQSEDYRRSAYADFREYSGRYNAFQQAIDIIEREVETA